MEPYPDEVSYAIVVAASEHLGVEPAALLRELGRKWVAYTHAGDYRMLYSMWGADLVEFLSNLDRLHLNVVSVMPELQPPAFKCTEVDDDGMRLHYYSERPGLAPFVVGLVEGLAGHFGTAVEVEPDRLREHGADHDEFLVRFATRRAAA